MPLPRRSTVQRAEKPKKATKRKKAPVSRARKGERLLVTCAPIMHHSAMESVADALMMAVLDIDGKIIQIVEVRIDDKARKIYGKWIELYEAAPYMYVPVSSRREE